MAQVPKNSNIFQQCLRWCFHHRWCSPYFIVLSYSFYLLPSMVTSLVSNIKIRQTPGSSWHGPQNMDRDVPNGGFVDFHPIWRFLYFGDVHFPASTGQGANLGKPCGVRSWTGLLHAKRHYEFAIYSQWIKYVVYRFIWLSLSPTSFLLPGPSNGCPLENPKQCRVVDWTPFGRFWYDFLHWVEAAPRGPSATTCCCGWNMCFVWQVWR